MSARDKIQKMTNGWYSLAVITGLATLLMNGLGIFSIAGAVLSTGFAFFLTWWIGKRLLNRSSLTRSICILLSVAGSLLGVLGIFGLSKELLDEFRLNTIVEIVLMGMSIAQNIRSFRTLTDATVKSYFAR